VKINKHISNKDWRQSGMTEDCSFN